MNPLSKQELESVSKFSGVTPSEARKIERALLKRVKARLATAIALAMLCASAHAGGLDNPNGGLQPSTGGLAATGRTWTVRGTVFQKLPGGMIVDCGPQVRGGGLYGLVYIAGDFPRLFNEGKVSLAARDAGTYEYTAGGGSVEVIRKLEAVR